MKIVRPGGVLVLLLDDVAANTTLVRQALVASGRVEPTLVFEPSEGFFQRTSSRESEVVAAVRQLEAHRHVIECAPEPGPAFTPVPGSKAARRATRGYRR